MNELIYKSIDWPLAGLQYSCFSHCASLDQKSPVASSHFQNSISSISWPHADSSTFCTDLDTVQRSELEHTTTCSQHGHKNCALEHIWSMMSACFLQQSRITTRLRCGLILPAWFFLTHPHVASWHASLGLQHCTNVSVLPWRACYPYLHVFSGR